MTIAYIGRHVTGPEIDRGDIGPNQMRACVYKAPTKNLWAHTFEGWLGRTGGTSPTGRFGAYLATPTPGERLGYSNSFTASTAYSDITGGAKVTASIAVNDRGTGTLGIPISSGEEVAISVLNTHASATMSHDMRQSSAISETDENFYDRSGIGSTPPDPYGSSVGVNNGHMGVWIVCDENEAPIRGINRSPSGSTTDTTPTFEWDFRDNNGGYGTDRSDYCSKYRIQVQQLVGSTWTTILNQEYTSTSTERSTDHMTRTPSLGTLAAGSYRWRQQDADYFGAYYAWSDADYVEFTIGTVATVTQTGNPAGSHSNSITPTFDGLVWDSSTGLSMTNARLQLLDGNTNDVIKDTDWDSKAAADGASFSFSPAQTGFGNLDWGRKYKYQTAGRDSNGVESLFSARRQFITNYAPTLPSNLEPGSSGPFTAPMYVGALITDEDDTPSGSGSGTQALVATCRLTRPDASTVDVTGIWDAAAGKFRKLLTVTELNQFGTYVARWAGYDGVIYSGEQTSLTNALALSGTSTFQYLAGPTVSITTPANPVTIATATLPVTWNPSTQAQYRVVLHTDGTQDYKYDTGWVVNAGTRTITIPAGTYHNGDLLDLLVGVKDGSGLEGWSSIVNVTVTFTPPDTLTGGLIEAVKVDNHDPFPTGFHGTFIPTQDPNFRRYLIYRSASGGPDANEILWAKWESQSLSEFIDPFPASGFTYTYKIYVVTAIGDEEIISAALEMSTSLELEAVVLADVLDPINIRMIVRRTGPGRSFAHKQDATVYYPPAGVLPRTVRRRQHYHEISIGFQLIVEDDQTARQHRDRIEAFEDEAKTLCYRDNEERKIFAVISDLVVNDEMGDGVWFTGTLSLRQESYVEGTTL